MSDAASPIVTAGVIAIFLALYFLPLLVAAVRGAKATMGVATLNLFLGWTVVGWWVAFIWSFGKTKAEAASEAQRHVDLMAAMGTLKATTSPAVR